MGIFNKNVLKYILKNNQLHFLENYTLSSYFIILIQQIIFGHYGIFFMSKEYIKSLNFKNIYEFYLFVLEIKNSEVDYIFNLKNK